MKPINSKNNHSEKKLDKFNSLNKLSQGITKGLIEKYRYRRDHNIKSIVKKEGTGKSGFKL